MLVEHIGWFQLLALRGDKLREARTKPGHSVRRVLPRQFLPRLVLCLVPIVVDQVLLATGTRKALLREHGVVLVVFDVLVEHVHRFVQAGHLLLQQSESRLCLHLVGECLVGS